jgi:DNA mismatch repair ATPase MutS
MKPYDNIYCYLNIIDTNDRFSLFQKECDKCKHILDEIKRRPDETHLCVFDELFSGTNPIEATSCSYSFLKYLSKNEKITFALTTHFTKLAKKIKRTIPLIQNMKMISKVDADGLKHTYKIKEGINIIKGGIEILKQLDFPDEITNGTITA